VAVEAGPGAPHRESIGLGLVALVGVAPGDTESIADWAADKAAALRVFPDDEGKMNRSVKDVAGAVLVVSQFTLLADTSRGNRPSFTGAAGPEEAAPLVERFAARLEREHGLRVARGVFGATMRVSLVNEGPVTIVLERPPGALRGAGT
jgi:D-tyrosyl-tRNA(Tyr) deacylase